MGVTAGIVEFADLNNASQEGPHLVRLKKACLRRRINGQLTLRYESGGLTSFAGLELVGRFIRRLDFRNTLRRVERSLPRSDFGAARLSMLVLAMLTLTSAKMQGAVLAFTRLQGANLKRASLQGAGHTNVDCSLPFADRIRKAQGQSTDVSQVEDGGLTQKRVDDLVGELLSTEKKQLLRTVLTPCIQMQPSRSLGLPQNHDAFLGAYTEEQAAEWIDEHDAVMSAAG